MKSAIAVFARAPVPGLVKTRLAKSIGDEAAAELYAAMLRDSLNLAGKASSGVQDCTVFLAYTPDNAFEAGPYSLSSLWNGPRLSQSEGDLGQRMLDCVAQLQAQGIEHVVIIGSDSPDLPSYIGLALWRLHEHPLVFGPTHDGGFYLMGASVPLPSDLFDGVEWGTPLALGGCLEAARRYRVRVNLILPWDDVDDFDDLSALSERLNSGISSAPATSAWLRSQNLFQDL